MHEIPERYIEEYSNLQKSQFKPRTALFILMAAGIYFLVSFFYFLRYLLGNSEAFQMREFYDWVTILLGSTVLYVLNAKTTNPERSKRYGKIYNLFLLFMIARLGFIYPANALVFPFYFALAFIIMAFTIPWSIHELYGLSAIFILAFSAFYAGLIFITKVEILALPRFHPYFDGLLFLLIVSGLSISLRKKRIERDIENFILLKEVEEKNAQIRQDLEFANRVHQSLIPPSVRTKQADIAVSYLPVSYVGGDYAKFHFLEDGRLTFFICDVTGHGVAAALMVNRTHTEFERLAKEGHPPGRLLARLNQFIHDDFSGTGMFLSGFSGALDFKAKKFLYSNYGHPAQYLYQVSHRRVNPLPAHTTLLGIQKTDKIHEHEVSFESGDLILLFTDGILEASSPAGEQFGSGRVENFLKDNFSLPVRTLNQALLEDLKRFNQGVSIDDVLLMSIKIE